MEIEVRKTIVSHKNKDEDIFLACHHIISILDIVQTISSEAFK